jgi:hypothetical protein
MPSKEKRPLIDPEKEWTILVVLSMNNQKLA